MLGGARTEAGACHLPGLRRRRAQLPEPWGCVVIEEMTVRTGKQTSFPPIVAVARARPPPSWVDSDMQQKRVDAVRGGVELGSSIGAA